MCSSDLAEQEYNTANQKIEQGDYAGAKSILKQMPVDYSSSIYAQAAMKRLFELESLAGNDYAGLKPIIRPFTRTRTAPVCLN